VSILTDSITRYSFSALFTARHAVVLVRRDLEGSGEVVQAVDPARGVISHEEHDTGAVFGPGEQELDDWR
jgi:hypothetical protein